MNYEEYKNLLINTFKFHHPKYLTSKLIKQLSDNGFINNSKRKSIKNSAPLLSGLIDIIDVSEIENPNDKIEFILNSDNAAFKHIEHFEFFKSYRYSVIFNLTELDIQKTLNSIRENKLKSFRRESDDFDNISLDCKDIIPTVGFFQDELIVKFSYLLTPKNTDSELSNIKYTVVCIIDEDNSILEMRFDRVAKDYHTLKDFYTVIVDNTITLLNEIMGISLENIDFKAIIDYIRINDYPDINIYAFEMRRNGGRASLDADSNEDLIIPILGDLQDLIKENNELFEANKDTIKIKDKLEYLIDDILSTSDLPSVKVFWPDQDSRVGIKHEYKNQGYSLFIFYDNLKESKERMDYVRNYFIEAYRKLNEKT
ncbi:MAG: hypothetical protein ACLSAJ_03380 [Intestinibacter bartlettii]|uniref:hypothetical protein n=1 Tax=Intestinibacter bartlettii TaxID=261299 RepID=UPI0039A0C65D